MYKEKRCILIADDEKKIVRALKDFLRINDFYTLEATDGRAALDVFYNNSTKIDLILLDVMMPYLDGFSVLEEIRQTSLVPVIMLTAKGEEYDQLQGFKTGADDYIPKPFSFSLLLARIESLLKRTGKAGSQDLIYGKIEINIQKRNVTLDNLPMDLTPKEFDLLYYFMLNQGITLSRQQLLYGVWGYLFEGDARTVDTHVKQLRHRLKDCSHYIKTIYKVGYRFEAS